MSHGTFDGVSGRMRHWRSRLPHEADLRDTIHYTLLDRFAFVSKPDFVVDAAQEIYNGELTLSCVAAATSGPRPEGCTFEGEPDSYDDKLDLGYQGWFPSSPSGYVVKSYPILRFDASGALQALYPERVVVETRNIANTRASTEPSDCQHPNCVVQETYTFSGAASNQHLIAATVFNDVFIDNGVFATNQSPELLLDSCSFRHPYGALYYLPLDVELATGPWADATDVWVRHYNTGNSSFSVPTPMDQIREVFVFRASASRRPLAGLVV